MSKRVATLESLPAAAAEPSSVHEEYEDKIKELTSQTEALQTFITSTIDQLNTSRLSEREKQNEVLEKTRSEVNDVIDTMTKTAEVLQDRSDKLGMTSLELQKLEESVGRDIDVDHEIVGFI